MSDPDTAGSDLPATFDVLALSPEVRRAVDELGYTHPTPVQRAVFEGARRGRDLVVQARTGTGKTAAFGLPLVDGLVRPAQKAVQAMVLSPTRELALQITREVTALAKYRGIGVVAVYGGAPFGPQVEQLQAGAQLLVGTPGRVLDHLRRQTLDASKVRVFVLDESDEMLSMGFLPQIREIEAALPASKQTLLFSATLPADVVRLAENRLREPEFLTLSGDHIGALEIQHLVYLSLGDRVAELLRIIEVENPESAIVFCNTRDETKRVAAALQQQGFEADWLNADLAQTDRERVMQRTRQGELRFLVATDVAARGIDISHLTHVINHDFPESPEQYVHRTGRTGRAGKTGTAISLVAPSAIGALYYLRLLYKIRPIERELPSARDLQTRAEADVVALFEQAFAERRHHPNDLALARRLMTHGRAEAILAGLLRDHLGARADAPGEAAAARRTRAPRPSVPPPASTPPQPSAMETRPEPGRPSAAPLPRAAEPRAEPARPSATPAPRAPEPRREPSVPTAPLQPRAPEPRQEPARESAPSAGEAPRPSEAPRGVEPPAPGRREEPRGRGEAPGRGDAPRAVGQGRSETASGIDTPRAVARGRSERTDPSDARTRNEAPRGRRGADGAPRDEDPRDQGTRDGDGGAGLEPGVSELFVNAGKKDGLRASELRDALCARAGLADEDVRFVRVRFRHSFVGVPTELAARAVEALSGATIGPLTLNAEPARRTSRSEPTSGDE